jgi:hypothetical protein
MPVPFRGILGALAKLGRGGEVAAPKLSAKAAAYMREAEEAAVRARFQEKTGGFKNVFHEPTLGADDAALAAHIKASRGWGDASDDATILLQRILSEGDATAARWQLVDLANAPRQSRASVAAREALDIMRRGQGIYAAPLAVGGGALGALYGASQNAA